MKRVLTAATALTLVLIAPLLSEAVPVQALSMYKTASVGTTAPTDTPATFEVMNLSDGGVRINQVVITLAPGLTFGDSSLAPNPGFAIVSGDAATGFTGQTATANSVTLYFTGFDRAETFKFSIDVDASNDRSAPGVAGSTLAVTFGGSVPTTAYDPVSVTWVNPSVVSLSTDLGVPGPPSNPGTVPTPEPATLFLLGSGLLGMGLATRKRWSGRIRN